MIVILSIYPWKNVDGEMSPFVAIFDGIGIAGAAHVLNVVVLTAAVSAYNSGLYANGRMLYSLSRQGNAPKFLGKLNRRGAPVGGVLASSAVTAIAVVMAFVVPDQVFEILISIALAAGIINWTMVTVTQMKFRKRIGESAAAKLSFKMPLYPVSNYMILVFLFALAVGMAFMPDYRWATIVGPVWIVVLTVAYQVKIRVFDRRAAQERSGTHETAS